MPTLMPACEPKFSRTPSPPAPIGNPRHSPGNLAARDARLVVARQREQQALQLRLAGATYAQIALQIGVAVMTAHKAVRRAIARIVPAEEAQEAKTLELQRLDAITLKMFTLMNDDTKGWQATVAAANTLLRICACRCRLLALDGASPPVEPEVDTAQQMKAILKPMIKGATEEELEQLREIYGRIAARRQAEDDAKPRSDRLSASKI